MKQLFAFLLFILPISAFCIPPQASFDSIQRKADGNYELTFTINGAKHIIDDSDGAATLFTLYYVLIEEFSDAAFRNKPTDPTVPVKHWEHVRTTMINATAKLVAYYRKLVITEPFFALAKEELEVLEQRLTQLKDRTPTYAELEKIFGVWLSKYVINHYYEENQIKDTHLINVYDDPTRAVLNNAFPEDKDIFVLHPQSRSRSKIVFNVNFEKLISCGDALSGH